MSSIEQDSRKDQFEKCLEEFLKYTSNEDPYNIAEKLEDFNAENVGSRFTNNNSSFIVHAAAIAFLNSPAIQESYIEKKRNYTFKPNFDFDELEESISGSADHICEISPKRRQISRDEVQKVISDKIYNDLAGFFKAMKNGILSDFFQDLTNPKGSYSFNSYDLYQGSKHKHELGKLWIDWIGDEKIPMFRSENGTSAVEFYSALLLLNRFEKNRMKQARINNRWFNEKNQSPTTIEWKYSENASAQINCILYRMSYEDNKSYAKLWRTWRSAKIVDVGKYDDRLKSNILSHANQLSSLFTNTSSQLSSEVAGLHFLLFGLEVMRNPSVLIHNMMMLDLIKNKPDFKETIYQDDFIPMGRDGSERASRFINDLYNKHMPHEYSFDISFEDYSKARKFSSDEKKEVREVAFRILKKECNLINKWLKLKYGEEEKEEIKNDANRFYGILTKACKEWYDIDMNYLYHYDNNQTY